MKGKKKNEATASMHKFRHAWTQLNWAHSKSPHFWGSSQKNFSENQNTFKNKIQNVHLFLPTAFSPTKHKRNASQLIKNIHQQNQNGMR